VNLNRQNDPPNHRNARLRPLPLSCLRASLKIVTMNWLPIAIFAAFFVSGFIAGLWVRTGHRPKPFRFDQEYIDTCAKIMRERRVKASTFYFGVFTAGMLSERSKNLH
jgi:hypothetical protein